MQTAVVERETRRAGKRAPHVSLPTERLLAGTSQLCRNAHCISLRTQPPAFIRTILICRDPATVSKIRTNFRTTNGWTICIRSFEHYAEYVALFAPNVDQLTLRHHR